MCHKYVNDLEGVRRENISRRDVELYGWDFQNGGGPRKSSFFLASVIRASAFSELQGLQGQDQMGCFFSSSHVYVTSDIR
jgi:hypothetical protein